MGISAPEPLNKDHDITTFDCGKPVLNQWLRKRALRNQVEGASRTYVVSDVVSNKDNRKVVGYYCIGAGSVSADISTGKIKRNMPDPVPVILLGRLAVDKDYANQGIGKGLMKDCYLRVVSIAEQVGVRALLVHALDDESRQYYLDLGFTESAIQARTLMVRVKDIVSVLQESPDS